MSTVDADSIFIPGGLPDTTYVPRAHLKIEDELARWIGRKQKPMLSLSGPTKSGKTVLLKRFLPDALWLSGGAIQTSEDFWQTICDELEIFTDHTLIAGAENSSTSSAGVALKAMVAEGSVETSSGDARSRGVQRSRTGSAKSSARRELKKLKPFVVIDDFHYIPATEQLEIVRGLKDLVFDGLPVIVAAVPHRAYDAVRVEKEMVGRVESQVIGLWTESDLLEIAQKGFNALQIEDKNQESAKRLAEESFGSPHLMQTHCLYFCFAHEESWTSANAPFVATPVPWDDFFAARASATSKTAFDLLKRGPRQRTDRIVRELKSGVKTDIYGAVLAAIESTGPKTSLTYEEVRAALRNVLDSDLPQRHEITNVLDQMTTIARENIEGEPVLEYDAELSTLFLVDPFFAYYMRWAPAEMKDLAVG